MILIIRISGMVEVPGDVQETLHRLGLRRKYSAVLIKPLPENLKLLQVIRNFVAYGDINNETLAQLIEKRAVSMDKKVIDVKKVIENLDKKSLKDQGIKPFFRLHPPIGGIDTKIHFGRKKGVLGDNKEKINALVRRML